MSEWKEYKLGEIASFKTGKLNSSAAVENGKYPFFTCSPVTLSIDKYEYNQKAILLAGNNAEGKFNIKYYEGKFNAYQRTYIIESNANICDLKFLYYSLQLNLLEFKNISQGTSTRFLTSAILNSFNIRLPLLAEQKRIASILGSLDDKIDLLHRENETLEAMAETLFRKWFIEDAKDEWEEGTLDDILSIKGGTTPSTKEPKYWNGKIAWTSPRDVTSLNGIYLFDTDRKITEDGLKQISSGLLPAGTLLMSSRAPVGALAYAEIPLAINQGYIAIIDNKGYSKEFIYLWLKLNMDLVRSYSNGSTFMEISKSAFKALNIQIPPQKNVEDFSKIIKPLFNKIKLNEQQIINLGRIKNKILPKLMSNELKI